MASNSTGVGLRSGAPAFGHVRTALLFDRYYSIRAYAENDPRGVDVYGYRGGGLDLQYTSTATDRSRSFTLDQVDPNTVRAVVARVRAEETPEAKITTIRYGVESDGALIIDATIEGAYENTYRKFDAVTGEALAGG